MADAPPPKKTKVDAFAAMRDKAAERKQKEEAEAREKASKPLPAPKPRGPAPKDLKQRPKTWDPLGGAVDTTNTSHPMGQYLGAWIGVEESDTDAEPLPAQRKTLGRPPVGYRWDPCAGPVVPCQGHAAGVYQGKYVNDDEHSSSSSDEEQDAQEVEIVCTVGTTFRTFQNSWLNKCPYIKLVGLDGVEACPSTRGASCSGCSGCKKMICSVCVERNIVPCKGSSANVYITGCCRFRKSSVLEHAANYHGADLDPKQLDIVVLMKQSMDAHEAKIKAIFKQVYFLAKEGVPLRKIKSLNALAKLLGVNLGDKYVNDMAAADMVMCLATVIRDEIEAWLKASPVHAAMIDESTDVGHFSQMMIYVRLMTKDGRFRTVFWRLLEVADADAAGLFSVFSSAYEMSGVPTSRLASFASDGAPVLTGKLNGVAVRIMIFNMFIIAAHCVAHRHALATSDAADGNETATQLDTDMRDVVNYHSNATKRITKLAKLQISLKVKRLAVLKFVTTRWLCRGGVALRLLDILPALVAEFQSDSVDEKVATATALYTLATSYRFLLSLCIYTDILTQMNLLSKGFQKEHVHYDDVMGLLGAVRVGLDRCYLDADGFRGGPQYGKLKAALDASDTDAFEFRGIIYERDLAVEGAVKRDAIKFASSIKDGLDRRFPNSEIMSALGIFDYTRWSQDTLDASWDATGFGDDKFDVLLRHYGCSKTSADGGVQPAFVDADRVRSEWIVLRELLLKLKRDGVALADGYAGLLGGDGMESMTHVKTLACCFLVLVLATVVCERGFSGMNYVKSKLRNNLASRMLDALLMIYFNGPDMVDAAAIDEIVDKAYVLWKCLAVRMPQRSHPGILKPRTKKPPTVCLLDSLMEKEREDVTPEGFLADAAPLDDDFGGADATAPTESVQATATATADAQVTIGSEELQVAVGPFPGLDGYEALPKPSGTSAQWAEEFKSYKWAGKRVAHIFADSWSTASYSREMNDSEIEEHGEGYRVFYYKDLVGHELCHDLNLEEWGASRSWIILEKIRPPSRSEPRGPRTRGDAARAPRARGL